MQTRSTDELLEDLRPPTSLDSALERILNEFGCVVGTIHSWDAGAGVLRMRAHRGLPPALIPRVETIPLGKGMAGLAAERREPVQVCNLQTDASGAAKPAARDTRMEGSITVPILEGAQLRGTLGIAKPVAYEFTPDETARLLRVGAAVAALFD